MRSHEAWNTQCPEPVWITGAGSGPGRYLAKRFGEVTTKLALFDSDHASLGDLTAAVTSASTVHAENVMPTSWASVHAAAQGVEASLGPVGTLIVTLGLRAPEGVLTDEISATEWKQAVSDVLTEAFHVVKAGIPQMRRRGSGVILLITTRDHSGGSPVQTSITRTVADRAVQGLTRTLAVELASARIRVNHISAVGEPRSEIEATSTHDLDQVSIQVAEAAVALAAKSSEMITGVVLPVENSGG